MNTEDFRPRAPVSVYGTQVRRTDPTDLYRQKLARITLDSMVQFVGLLDAEGTVLEINKVALDAVGVTLSEVQGRPFWTTFWWQVSEEVNATLRDYIRRAAAGEFVRWDTPIYGRAGEAFETLAPQVVLLDIGLPDLDGYEVGRRMRSSATGKKTLLLALTGWGQVEDKRRAVEAGFDEHLTKPVDAAFLSLLLEEKRGR